MASLLLALLQIPVYYFLEVIYFLFRCRPKKQMKDEHVLITGAAQGIGGGLADKFAEMGNTVHCVDIDSNLVQKKVDGLRAKGFKAHAYTCDLTKREEVEQLHKDIIGDGHTVTVLINNAGVAFGISIGDQTLNQLNQSMTLNLTSNLWLIKLFLPKMIELNKGHVVNMASAAGLFPIPKCTDYCAAKAASIHTMNQLRTEFVESDVKFTAICPAFVETNMTKGLKGRVNLLPLEVCVNRCIKGILENKEILIIPTTINIAISFYTLLPSPLQKYTLMKRLEAGQKMAEKNK